MNNIRSVTALALLIIAVAAARPAAAQGTFGSLPDPISSSDLDVYAERLSLSDQQLLAISEHHRQYLADFRDLREGDIQDLLDGVRTLASNFDFSQRREVERTVRSLNRIMQQIRMLDERLFDQMQTVLTDEQAAGLPRVRLLRERLRYSGEMTRGIDFINPGVRVDLSTIVHDMDLAPDVLEVVDPTLAVYEQRLARGAQRLFDTTTTMILDALKQLAEMGFTEGTPRDPETALRLFEAFESIWGELSADLMKEASEVASLQRSTYRSLAALLPPDAVRDLRLQYFRRAYPEAAMLGEAMQRGFDAALQLEELSERQREAIEAMAHSHWQSQNRLAEKIADLLDERRKSPSIRDIVRRREDERQQQIDDLRAQAEAADDAMRQSLNDLLGPELVELADSQRRANRSQQRRPWSRRVQAAEQDGGDPFIGRVPSRISTAEVSQYAAALSMDENQAVILESIHADYLERYDEYAQDVLVPLREATAELAAMDLRMGRVAPEQAQRAEAIFALQRTAFDTMRELDEALFDDLAAVIEPSQVATLERLRLQRERMTYTGDGRASRRMNWRPNQNREADIDLRRLVDELQLASASSGDVDGVLLEYEQQATALFRDKYHAELQTYQTMLTINAREDRRRFREAMGPARQAVAAANAALAELNRAALERLQGLLPGDSAHHLQHAYRQRAFPAVYDDETRAEPAIAAALSVESLSESQRSRLRELSLSYRSEYARIADRMYQVHEAAGPADGDNRSSREERMHTRNELERLRFERNELNENARRQLRSILSDEQLQHVGL